MVIMIVAILGATALPQFLDFRQEARLSVVRQNLQAMRTGIKLQIQQAILKCNASPGYIPELLVLSYNDIAGEGSDPCFGIISGEDVKLITGGKTTFGPASRGDLLIENVLKDPSTSAIRGVVNCNGYTNDPCNAAALSITRTFPTGGELGGWCYDQNSGHFWAQTDIASACAL